MTTRSRKPKTKPDSPSPEGYTRVCYAEDVGPGKPTDQTMIPWRCPVCIGRGSMNAGFYEPTTLYPNTESVPCRSCDGTGIVWGQR